MSNLIKILIEKENQFFYFFFILSFILSILILLILSGYLIKLENYDEISKLLITDLSLIIILILITFFKVMRILKFQKKKVLTKGKNLHNQITILLSIITIIPSIAVTGFSIIFFDQGVKTWFNEKVNTAISGSKIISESYFKEHSNNLKSDLVFLNNEINNEKIAFFTNRDRLTDLLKSLVYIKMIDEAIIFEKSGQLLAKVGKSFLIEKEPPPPLWSLLRADEGEIPIFTNKTKDKVRGLIKLDRVIPTYLYIGKGVDNLVLTRVESVNSAASKYLNLAENLEKLQNLSYQLFLTINILVILIAVWFGLLFANRLTAPIEKIILLSEQISSGNLKTKIKESSGINDFNILAISLNKMVETLLKQKNKLSTANKTINNRRRFTEAVLEGVSAGVIYLDLNFNVILFNKRSSELINNNLKNKKIGEILPEILPLLNKIKENNLKKIEEQIKIVKRSQQKIVNIKITCEFKKNEICGMILTFDDVTELVSAQKQAAWSTVAQYLAHEIKNPLTPINLSAQRIFSNFKSKNLNQNIVENCTETIIRQVKDIKKLVTEFSEFARMPQSVFEKVDLHQIVDQQINNQKIINKKIKFTFIYNKKKLIVCDAGKISRLIINLIKNSVESVINEKKKNIRIKLIFNAINTEIFIEDSGKGFPKDKMRLFEPYITSKKRGTGLGLAICKKIVEEHDGEISLFNSLETNGAGVKILLPERSKT